MRMRNLCDVRDESYAYDVYIFHVKIFKKENMKFKYATTSENVPLDMCAQRRVRSVCAFALYDQHFHRAHFG